jgi:hypothetical protein
MAYAIWSEVDQATTERWREPDTPDTESLLEEVETESPLMYAIPALVATDDADALSDGASPAHDADSSRGAESEPPERQFLDGLILAGLVNP